MAHKKIPVKKHKRGLPNKPQLGKRVPVEGFKREPRPKGKKKIISKKPIKLFPVKDEFGRFLGFSNKPPKPKPKNFGFSPLDNFGIKHFGFTQLGPPRSPELLKARRSLAVKFNSLDNNINRTIEGGKRSQLEKERENLVKLLKNTGGSIS